MSDLQFDTRVPTTTGTALLLHEALARSHR
jgi:hypothetical protein